MSYVSIWKPVNDQIVQVSRQSERNEIIGLLLGRLENDTMIIEDSITGEFQGEPDHVVLPPSTLAKIADELVSGRRKGNIIGWYHSHIEIGLLFSETDVQTQKGLQQFSALITAMVVDAKTGRVGYFRVDRETGNTIRIPESNVTVVEQLPQFIRPETSSALQANLSSPNGMPEAPPGNLMSLSSKIVILFIILAVVLGVAIVALLFYRFGISAAHGGLHMQIAGLTVR
jgi:proteasome lid subunit RPN8/RPN11